MKILLMVFAIALVAQTASCHQRVEDVEQEDKATAQPPRRRWVTLSAGAGVNATPLPGTVTGFPIFGAQLGVLVTEHDQIIAFAGSHPTTGESDYGTKAEESYRGLGYRRAFGDLASRRPQLLPFLQLGIEDRKIAIRAPTGSTFSSNRSVSGSARFFDIGIGLEKKADDLRVGATSLSCELLRLHVPISQTIDLDEGGLDDKKDSYFNSRRYDLFFTSLAIAF